VDRSSGGGFCGCIFLILATIGGYTVYQNFSGGSLPNLPFIGGNADCQDGREWVEAANSRYIDAINRGNQLSPYTSSPDDLQEYSDLLQRYAQEQRNSNPPVAGRELNEQWGFFYQMLSQNYEAVAHGDQFPNSEAALTTLSNEILQAQDEFNEKCG
jgi:hypothetical protein